MSRTWDCDCRFPSVDPTVRRNEFYVLDRESLWGAGARWLGYRLDDPGWVQAIVDVG